MLRLVILEKMLKTLLALAVALHSMRGYEIYLRDLAMRKR